MRKVVFVDAVHSILKDRLESIGFDCVDATKANQDEFIEEIKGAFGIVIRSRFTLDARLLDNAKSLRFIARSGSGTENVDSAYCTNKGIRLFSSVTVPFMVVS